MGCAACQRLRCATVTATVTQIILTTRGRRHSEAAFALLRAAQVHAQLHYRPTLIDSSSSRSQIF
jgi:hypothetical protein